MTREAPADTGTVPHLGDGDLPPLVGDGSLVLRIGSAEVARYVHAPKLDQYLSPRPYLHPVRTLGGTIVTDAVPEDHHWHLGVSVALQDVGKVNFWGGRTYVRDAGYTPLDDHGSVQHRHWQNVTEDGFQAALEWIAPGGSVLLEENRTVRARALTADPRCWWFDFSFRLHNVTTRPLHLGSPATNGRAGGGYGGFFWRAPGSAGPIDVFTDLADGEEAVHGSTAPWLAFTADSGDPAAEYTLVFLAPDDSRNPDPWFVRVEAYPGVCAALAFVDEVVLAPGNLLFRRQRVLVADGRLTRAGVTRLLSSADQELRCR